MRLSGVVAVALTVIVCVVLTTAGRANADVISGTVALDLGGWDFSQQTSMTWPDADIAFAFVVDPPLGLRVAAPYPPARILMLSDSTYEDLKYAPDDSALYGMDAPALIGPVYVAKTKEGRYAKFRILHLPYDTPIIEYVYQPDGTRRFYNGIGVESSTWSSVKTLFR